MFPFFCDLVAKKDRTKLGEILTRSSRMLLALFIPLSLVCVVYAPVLVQLLVAGKFSERDASLSGLSMAIYTLVLPAFSLEMLLMQAFFAERRMISVTLIGILFSTFSILFSYAGIIHFGSTGAAALAVVATGYVLSRSFKTLALIFLLRRSVPLFPRRETWMFLAKTLVAGILATAAVQFVFTLCGISPLPVSGKAFLIVKLAFAAGAGIAVFAAASLLLRLHEPAEMLIWVKKKIGNRRCSPPTPESGTEHTE
jgi:peptidoglycan biosynthesis protein MviN/MurJ (putative lipid II flippase)